MTRNLSHKNYPLEEGHEQLIGWQGGVFYPRLLSICFTWIVTITMSFAQPVKVMSFNIRLETVSDGNNQWQLRKESVVDFLNYESADFIGMQEALWSQMQDLQTGLPMYKWIGVGRDDGEKEGEFSPIFYLADHWDLMESGTFWLSETPEKPSRSWDAALPRICTWGKFKHKVLEVELFVFNTHYDHVGKQARINSSVLITERIHELSNGKQIVLLGDFNTEPNTEPVNIILKKELIDSFKASDIRFGSIGTFNGFNLNTIPKRRIDYVFLSSNMEAIRYGVASQLIEGRYLSDHFPVVVEIRFK